MPSATTFQTNFSAGELSPRLYARVDIAKYMNGAQKVENFIIQRFGGARKRGGSQFINEAKNAGSNLVRLIPFVFSVEQAYILEFGPSYIRIYTNGGIVTSGGSPVEVATPYGQSELFDIQFAQSADVLYLTHPNHKPRQFSRISATSFTLTEIDFRDGPYLELNDTGTTLKPSAYGALTPLMTSNSAPSGTVTTDVLTDPWKAFDKNESTTTSVTTSESGYVAYQLPSGNQVAVDRYYVTASPHSDQVAQMPSSWVIEGSNDGSTWVAIDTQAGQSGWSAGETRFYEFANEATYEYHRFRWKAVNGSDSATSRFAEIGFNRRAANQTPFNLTASSTTGINGGQGFLTTDVGRMIRLLGSDGKWRWAEIQARTSSTVVTVVLHGHALPDLSPIVNWQIGAWSDETGWPACVGFYNGRLCFARTETQPQTVWMSVVDDFTNFGVSDPLQDDDAINVTIASDSLNAINWIAEGTDLFVGTTAAIRTIGPTSSAAAFSPTNIQQRRETNYGASNVQPVRVGTTAIYSGYYRKDIREVAYSFDFNGYVSQDLSILAEHIPATGVKQIAYSQNPEGVVWGVDDNGVLFGMTYERDQEVVAFHRHPLGGTDGTVESVATIPGSGFDEVWIVVRRLINGATTRYIERLTEGLGDTENGVNATFLDSHLTYSGASTSVLSGLDHLEGEDVYVWGAGDTATVQGPFTVSGGSITLTSAVTTACVGLSYTSALETLSPEAAARGGTAQSRLGRISEVFVRVNRSIGGECGPSDGTLETLDYTASTNINGNFQEAGGLFTGDVRVPIPMEWGRQKRIRIEHSEPTPFHVLGLISEIRVSG